MTTKQKRIPNYLALGGVDTDADGRILYGAPKGLAGAPQGYAASRAGQPGALFEGEGGRAPGTSDWERYGTDNRKPKDAERKPRDVERPAGVGAAFASAFTGYDQAASGYMGRGDDDAAQAEPGVFGGVYDGYMAVVRAQEEERRRRGGR